MSARGPVARGLAKVSSRGTLGKVTKVAAQQAPCSGRPSKDCWAAAGKSLWCHSEGLGTLDHTGRQQGWAAVGSQLAFCHGFESATHVRGPFTGLRVAPYPCPPMEACLHGGQACSQSTFSTLPMIFSSKTGSAASSSRTSSNTTPQSNSSLTFLK